MDCLGPADCIRAMEYLEYRHRTPFGDKERPGFMVIAAMIEKEAKCRLSKLQVPDNDVVSFFNEIYSVLTGKGSFNDKNNTARDGLNRIKRYINDIIGVS
jgi:hypothetical protein